MSAGDDLDPGLVERVLTLVRRIPPGRVVSYGDVARLASAPTARDVGQVMLRHGDQTPWWRVLRADGTPAPHLREEQLARLRAEGTPMVPSGEAVDLRHARWSEARRGPDPDAQPSLFD
jgi:methylated-DNA-protein-cysteine methyltransferase related protein